jgi:DNA-binding response OmpR family regulator
MPVGNNKRIRILVADDDVTMCHMLIDFFHKNNVSARRAASPEEFDRVLGKDECSLIILEIQFGERDGFDLLRKIRKHSDVPVIIATGHRCDETDRIIGLELGADDYIAKPFSPRELLARVRAVLRRFEIGRTTAKREPERGGYRFKGWRLQRRNRSLTCPNGTPVPLTKGEYALLVAFLSRPQHHLTRDQLLHATRIHEDVFDRSIDVQVLRLRRKLAIDPAAPRFIQTVRGIGYVFNVVVEAY